MHSPETLQEARDRNGAPAESRPDRVDSYLSDIGQEPVEWEGTSDLWAAENYEPLKALCEHSQVAGPDDVAAAIPGAGQAEVRKVLRLHDLSVSENAASGSENTVETPLGETIDPTHYRTPLHQSGRLLEALYCGAGLGVSEIVTVVEGWRRALNPDASAASHEVSARQVRAELEACGLIPESEDVDLAPQYGVEGRFDVGEMHREARENAGELKQQAEEKGMRGGVEIDVSEFED